MVPYVLPSVCWPRRKQFKNKPMQPLCNIPDVPQTKIAMKVTRLRKQIYGWCQVLLSVCWYRRKQFKSKPVQSLCRGPDVPQTRIVTKPSRSRNNRYGECQVLSVCQPKSRIVSSFLQQDCSADILANKLERKKKDCYTSFYQNFKLGIMMLLRVNFLIIKMENV